MHNKSTIQRGHSSEEEEEQEEQEEERKSSSSTPGVSSYSVLKPRRPPDIPHTY
jgi:hypothetical protein